MYSLIFVTLISLNAISQSPAETRTGPSRPHYETPFTDPFAESVYSTVKTPKVRRSEIPFFQAERIQSSHFQVSLLPSLASVPGNLRAASAIQKSSTGQILPAPLIVIFPGIFSSRDESRLYYYMKEFSDKGYHVLALPNSLGASYLADLPRAKPTDFIEEAKAILDVVQTFKRRLSQQNALLNTQLFAWSYGAWLGAISLAIDAKESMSSTTPRIFDGPAFLFSPPVNIQASIQRLDKILDDTYGYMKGHSPIKQLVQGVQPYLSDRVQSQKDLTPQGARDARAIAVYAGFGMDLQEMLFNYDHIHNLKKIPDVSGLSAQEKLDLWSQIRFRDYYEKYEPDLKAKYSGPIGYLFTWLNFAHKFGNHEITIFSSLDDFLNVPEDWTSHEAEITLVDHGGHLGFTSLPWFDDILESRYPKVIQH